MKRFTVVNEGYNIEEVNRFIDIVIKRLEKLNNENAMLQTKISSLEEKLKEEKVSEIKVTEAIMAARDTSDRIKSLAREEANMIVEEARNNANAIVHEALIKAEKIEARSTASASVISKETYGIETTAVPSAAPAPDTRRRRPPAGWARPASWPAFSARGRRKMSFFFCYWWPWNLTPHEIRDRISVSRPAPQQ